MTTTSNTTKTRLHPSITAAAELDRQDLRGKIAKLQEEIEVLKTLEAAVLPIAMDAARAMDDPDGEPALCDAQSRAYKLTQDLLGLVGYCHLYRALQDRHVDLWATYGQQ